MSDTSDLDQQIEQLRKCEIIKESEVKNLCAKAREILGNKERRIWMKKHVAASLALLRLLSLPSTEAIPPRLA